MGDHTSCAMGHASVVLRRGKATHYPSPISRSNGRHIRLPTATIACEHALRSAAPREQVGKISHYLTFEEMRHVHEKETGFRVNRRRHAWRIGSAAAERSSGLRHIL